MFKKSLAIMATLAITAGSAHAISPEHQDMFNRGCATNSNDLLIGPACTFSDTMQQGACVKSFAETGAQTLTQKYGNYSSTALSKLGIARNIDWQTTVRGWESLGAAVNNNPRLSDAALWILATPWSFDTGTYNAAGYIYVRANLKGFSAHSVVSLIEATQKNNMRADKVPLWRDFVKAFYAGDSDAMLAMMRRIEVVMNTGSTHDHFVSLCSKFATKK